MLVVVQIQFRARNFPCNKLKKVGNLLESRKLMRMKDTCKPCTARDCGLDLTTFITLPVDGVLNSQLTLHFLIYFIGLFSDLTG